MVPVGPQRRMKAARPQPCRINDLRAPFVGDQRRWRGEAHSSHSQNISAVLSRQVYGGVQVPVVPFGLSVALLLSVAGIATVIPV